MSLLSTVTNGVVPRPHYILLHSEPGIGKTTFGSNAPNPIFLCAEKGTRHLDVNRLELGDFQKFLEVIEELRVEKHDYQTVIVDTVDHVEPLIHRLVCADKKKESIEDIGYAKGYIYALEYWRELVAGLERLRDERGMNIILLAHTEIKSHNDPQLPEPYDTYKIRLHHKAAAILVERVECVLFAKYFTHIEEKEGASKVKAYGDGTRVVFTDNRPSFLAKNRFNLPFMMPFKKDSSWQDFEQACIASQNRSISQIKENILKLLPEVKDKETKEKIEARLKEVGDDPKMLIAIEERIKTIVAA